MRIAFVTPYYYPNILGGSEISVKLLAEKLSREQNEVTVISFDCSQGFRKIERLNGVRIIRYRNFLKFYSLLTLMFPVTLALKNIEKEIDVIHIYGVFPASGSGLYKLIGGKRKVVVTLNNYAGFCPSGWALFNCYNCGFIKKYTCLRKRNGKCISVFYSLLFPVLQHYVKSSDVYIALSKSVKKFYFNQGFNDKKIIIIPNFFDKSMFKFIQCERNSEKKSFDILYVGQISEHKGVHCLLIAFSKIAAKNPFLRLTLIGDGIEKQGIKRMATHLGLQTQVTVLDFINGPEKFKYFANADLFIHPGYWPEPFGRVLLEAMSFGIPTIVSDAGALSEVVGTAGIVFKNGDPNDLAYKIGLIINNRELRNKLRCNCPIELKKYEEEFIYKKLLSLYNITSNGC